MRKLGNVYLHIITRGKEGEILFLEGISILEQLYKTQTMLYAQLICDLAECHNSNGFFGSPEKSH